MIGLCSELRQPNCDLIEPTLSVLPVRLRGESCSLGGLDCGVNGLLIECDIWGLRLTINQSGVESHYMLLSY